MIYNRILNDFLFFFYGLFIFGSTFSIAIGQIGIGISLILFLIITLINRRNPFPGQLKYLWYSIALYIGWMALSAIMGETPVKSLSILKEEWLFVGVPIGIYLFYKERFRKKLLFAFACGILLISIYGIIQHLTGVHWFKDTPPNPSTSFGYIVKGFFAHRLTFGNYYATASLFICGYLAFAWKNLSTQKKWFYTITAILSSLVTILSYSYGPILALFGGFTFLFIVRYRMKAILLISALIIVGIVMGILMPGLINRASAKVDVEMNPANEGSRLYIWGNAITMIEQDPLFGVGQGNFWDRFKQNMPGHRIHVHAHNDFLNIGALGGIPAMLFFISIWGSLFWYYRTGLKNAEIPETDKPFIWAACCGALVFMLSSLTEATFADEEVRQMLMFVWAAGLWPILTRKSGTNQIEAGKTS